MTAREPESMVVDSVPSLLRALASGEPRIAIAGRLQNVPSFELRPGQHLTARVHGAALGFEPGAEGVGLSAGNSLTGLALRADACRRAVWLATPPAGGERGELLLDDVRTTGQLQFLFGDETSACRLRLADVWVEDADVRERTEFAEGNGVRCLQGAVTVWNRGTGDVDLAMERVAVGAVDRPVRGGGIFIAGRGADARGQVRMDAAETGPVCIDSGLAADETSIICGGVFVLPGARARRLRCIGPQWSCGPNAVPIDNWGHVDEWIVEDTVVTEGPNAVAMVNAGELGRLELRGGIETFGDGARGCAVYADMDELRIARLRTHGRGATGVQVGARLGHLVVAGDIDIRGRAGTGMVKGHMEPLPADGVRIERDGAIGRIDIGRTVTADPAARALRDERVPHRDLR